MKKLLWIAAAWTTLTAAQCDGEPDFVVDGLDNQHNVRILLPIPSNGEVLRVDTIGAEPVFRDQMDKRPPIFDSFRLTCPRGGCVRFNLYVDVGRTFRGWAAGRNCIEERPFSTIWPVKAQGLLGEARAVRTCCPHNAPCNLDRVFNPNNAGGADWIIGVLPNGRLATTLQELRTICPKDIEGAIEYEPHIFGNFNYPAVALSRSGTSSIPITGTFARP